MQILYIINNFLASLNLATKYFYKVELLLFAPLNQLCIYFYFLIPIRNSR